MAKKTLRVNKDLNCNRFLSKNATHMDVYVTTFIYTCTFWQQMAYTNIIFFLGYIHPLLRGQASYLPQDHPLKRKQRKLKMDDKKYCILIGPVGMQPASNVWNSVLMMSVSGNIRHLVPKHRTRVVVNLETC